MLLKTNVLAATTDNEEKFVFEVTVNDDLNAVISERLTDEEDAVNY